MANVKDYRIKGHESFVLREGWLNKGLEAVENDPAVFSKNSGADALGVGTNMAKAIRYWLKASELTYDEKRKGTVLTDIGKLIRENDPYIEDIFTLWLVHSLLVSNFRQATSWTVFFNDFDLDEFDKETMYMQLKMLIPSSINVLRSQNGISNIKKNINISKRSLEDDCSAILSMYVKEKLEDYDPEDKKISPFSTLGLIRKNGNIYSKSVPDLKDLDELLIYYVMAKEMGNEQSITVEELLKKRNMPGKIFNLKRTALVNYLEQLSSKKMIVLNQTAGLDMVYLKEKILPLEILKIKFERMRKNL